MLVIPSEDREHATCPASLWGSHMLFLSHCNLEEMTNCGGAKPQRQVSGSPTFNYHTLLPCEQYLVL
jgi:hypothetical protein